jgi:LysR family nitrogen assimilation transcriptional regulator
MGRIEHQSIDIRRLRYFIAVCDHGGFSKAASAIGVAQPVLTRHVQLLEQELGLELFSRNGRGALPTKPGQFLLENARSHIEGIDSVAEQLRRTFKQEPVDVALGICPTIKPLFLDDLQSFIQSRCPYLNLSVIEAYSGDLRNLAECGRIDLALTYQPLTGDSMQGFDLLSEPLVVVRSASRRVAVTRFNLTTLAKLHLILPSQIHQLRKIIDRVCRKRGLTLTPALELDSLNAVKLTLDDPGSDLATILPYHAVREDEESGRFAVYRIADAEMMRTISLIRSPAAVEKPVPEPLVEHIRSHAKHLKATLRSVF